MPVKFLYLPNEGDEHDPDQLQVGPRKAFGRLLQEGHLSELSCFSFLSKYRQTHDDQTVKAALLEEVRRMQPDVIFWQHVSEFPVSRDFVLEVRRSAPDAILVYHDPDPFDGRSKPLSAAMRVLLSNSDLALACGLRPMSDLMRQGGAREVRYLPHSYDNVRFGTDWVPSDDRPYSATMIGNSIRRRVPPFYLPGGRRRAELARKLTQLLGAKFALYGNGWRGLSSSLGPLSFNQQERVIRDSWVSVNWDHFDDISYYSSDRLPISLATGVVHVTSHHDGYEYLFSGCPGLYACRSVDEAVSCTEWLLSRPKSELLSEGLAASTWVQTRFEADVVYRRAVEMCMETLASIRLNRAP